MRADVVRMRAHHEAVEERDGAPGAGAGEDAAGRQEGEIGHRLVEAPFPAARRFLGAAAARATRRQVSSIVLSSGAPSGALSRYFMSQICWEIGGRGEDCTLMTRGRAREIDCPANLGRAHVKSQ